MEQESTNKHGDEPNPVDSTGLCLLSLDGGGMRGLSSLYILKSIMDRLNYAREQSKLPRVKPCEVFDLIGGTSTGGLIAIMLGRLEMDVDQCIDAYSDLTAAVFGERLRSIPVNFKGDITARFDSAKLESAIQNVVEDSGVSKEGLFNDGTKRGCRTFVCTADRHTKDIIRLRSYSLPHEPNIRATICQAALATSAATTFFEPISIGDRSFADGGLGANNPVDEVEGEASNIWCPETGDLKQLVKCFISIGTGNPGKKPFEDSMLKFLGQTVVQIATETENMERRFIARWARHFDDKRYFRFNVEQGLQDIGLEEYKKKGAIEAATESYLTHMAQKLRVRDCIQNMRLKQNKSDMHFATLIREYIIRTNQRKSVQSSNVPIDFAGVPVIEIPLGPQDGLVEQKRKKGDYYSEGSSSGSDEYRRKRVRGNKPRSLHLNEESDGTDYDGNNDLDDYDGNPSDTSGPSEITQNLESPESLPGRFTGRDITSQNRLSFRGKSSQERLSSTDDFQDESDIEEGDETSECSSVY